VPLAEWNAAMVDHPLPPLLPAQRGARNPPYTKILAHDREWERSRSMGRGGHTSRGACAIAGGKYILLGAGGERST